MIVSDGSGNRYSISANVILYSPVTEAESSSGLYSGGSPKAAALNTDEQKTLGQLFDRALRARESHAQTRAKGTIEISRSGEGPASSVILKHNSTPGVELETFLKKLRDNADRQIPVQYRITRDRNPWHGLTESAAQEERNRTLRAAKLPVAGYNPVALPEAAWRGRALLYRGDAAREIVVDASAFSTLKRPDAARLKAGEEIRVGQALRAELLEPRFLLPFLLHGEIVQTYWHTDSRLDLSAAEERGNRVCYQFNGEHHYYTNEKNTGKLHFSICTDAKSGEIFVIGR